MAKYLVRCFSKFISIKSFLKNIWLSSSLTQGRIICSITGRQFLSLKDLVSLRSKVLCNFSLHQSRPWISLINIFPIKLYLSKMVLWGYSFLLLKLIESQICLIKCHHLKNLISSLLKSFSQNHLKNQTHGQ